MILTFVRTPAKLRPHAPRVGGACGAYLSIGTALLFSRFLLTATQGFQALFTLVSHTAHARTSRPTTFTRAAAPFLGSRRVSPLFDGFFFPFRTHLGYNLSYLTPQRRARRRRNPRRQFPTAASGALRYEPPRASRLSPLPPLDLSGFEVADPLRTPTRVTHRLRHYRGLLGSYVAITQPLDPEESPAVPGPQPTLVAPNKPSGAAGRGLAAWLGGPCRRPRSPQSPTSHLFRSDRARRGAASFASYEASMSRWSLVAARFRPGFSTEWRRCRAAFNQAWGLGFARQHRLTRFVLSLRHFWGFSFLRVLSLSLGRLSRLSYLTLAAPGHDQAYSLRAGGWLINGLRVNNPFLQVFVGDFFAPLPGAAASAATLYDGVSLLRYHRYLQLQALVRTPLALAVDTPPFLEVDELAAAASLLYEPRGSDLLLDPQVGAAPYLTVRVYNWKYVT